MDFDWIDFNFDFIFNSVVRVAVVLSIVIRNANSATNYNLTNVYNLNDIDATINGDNGATTLNQNEDNDNDANKYNETNVVKTQQKSISEDSANHVESTEKAAPKQTSTQNQPPSPTVTVQTAQNPSPPITTTIRRVPSPKQPSIIQAAQPENIFPPTATLQLAQNPITTVIQPVVRRVPFLKQRSIIKIAHPEDFVASPLLNSNSFGKVLSELYYPHSVPSYLE